MVVTHFHELTTLATMYADCQHCAMAAQPVGDGIEFQYKASDPSSVKFISDYGIRAAHAMGCPETVVNLARKVKLHLSSSNAWSHRVLPLGEIQLSVEQASKFCSTAHTVEECPILAWLENQAASEETGHREASREVLLTQIAKLSAQLGGFPCVTEHILDAQGGGGMPGKRCRGDARAERPSSECVSPITRSVEQPRKRRVDASAETGNSAVSILFGNHLSDDTASPPLGYTGTAGPDKQHSFSVASHGWDAETQLSSIGLQSVTGGGRSGGKFQSTASGAGRSEDQNEAAAALLRMFGGE
jgi:hypothetical protein